MTRGSPGEMGGPLDLDIRVLCSGHQRQGRQRALCKVKTHQDIGLIQGRTWWCLRLNLEALTCHHGLQGYGLGLAGPGHCAWG